MTERLSGTRHGDAPLSSVHSPDATAADVGALEADDRLIARTVTIDRPLSEVFDFLADERNLLRIAASDDPPWPSLLIEGEGRRHEVSLQRRNDDDEADRQGRVTLRPAPAGRGTEVTITFATEARNLVRRAVDKLTGDDPRMASRRALRRLKQWLETGEIATSQPGRAAPRA